MGRPIDENPQGASGNLSLLVVTRDGCDNRGNVLAGRELPQPFQFSITTVQPLWRERDGRSVWGWEYCIPHRLWCAIRGRIGAWTICGRVMVCGKEKEEPLGGIRVFAFDRDWLQDDALGSAVTDGSGKFRIDYTPAAFRPGTFINIELIGGPDLYFRVETTGGNVLLNEPPSRARHPDRENVGPCFCVKLCVDPSRQPGNPVDSYPAFTSIGGYDFSTQIDSAPAGTGLTAGDHRAFYSAIRLNGILSKKFNGSPMEYQFDVSELDGAGNPVAWHVVDSSQIAPTDIGKWEHYAPAFPGDPNPIKIKHYVVNGAAGPSTLVPSVVAGWIRVPQESDVFAASGSFVPNGNQILLDTTTLRPWPSIDLTGLQAGQSSTSTGKALATDVGFALRMRVREVGSAAAGTVAGFCQRVAIDNTLYDHLLHHPEWMAVNESNALGVAMIDIQEEISHPCSEIADSLTVLFTAAHPNLGAPSISMSGPGGPYAFTLPAPATAGDQFGTATPSGFVVADLAPCAYIVGLSVPLLLTTGDSVPLPLYDQMPFCKGSPMMGGGGGGD